MQLVKASVVMLSDGNPVALTQKATLSKLEKQATAAQEQTVANYEDFLVAQKDPKFQIRYTILPKGASLSAKSAEEDIVVVREVDQNLPIPTVTRAGWQVTWPMLTMLNDFVAVAQLPIKTTTVALPDNVGKDNPEGFVIGVGPDCKSLKRSDLVRFNSRMVVATYTDIITDGHARAVLVISEKNIFCKL